MEPASGPVEVMIRPERLVAAPGDDGTVESIEYYGHDAVYLVRLDDGTPVRSRVIGAPALGPGSRISLRFTGAPTMAYPPEGAPAERVEAAAAA